MPESTLQRAYLAGIDHVPWPTEVHWDGRVLIVERDVRESGHLYLPWVIEGLGEFTLGTASLMERRQPYHLPLELARGVLNRLRHQLASWKLQQIELSPAVAPLVDEAERAFIATAIAQADATVAADLAEESLKRSMIAMQAASADFAQKLLTLRHQQTPQLATLLAADAGEEPFEEQQAKWLLEACNTLAVPVVWRQTQLKSSEWNWYPPDQQLAWCHENEMKVIAGPLLRPSVRHFPEWLEPRGLEFSQLHEATSHYLEQVVKHFQGRVHVWNVASGMNVESTIRLGEEERLRLTVAALDVVRRTDPRTPMIVSFDQPWGEFMGRRHVDLPPLHFADMLVRSNLGVAGLGLEINFGYWPQGTWPRDLGEIGRMIDQWSTLGLPLVVYLSIPSDQTPDALAGELARPLSHLGLAGPSRDQQKNLAEAIVPYLLAKPAVHGIVWSQLRDDRPHEFAHGGLFDADGQRKPVVEILASLRRNHLL